MGGAAILIEPNTKRSNHHLDYFHDTEKRVAEAFEADRSVLERAGQALQVDLQQPGYVRAVERTNEDATRGEWARDSSRRFLPPVRDDRVGFVLHPVDLAVSKVLTLAGRDETRDVLDVSHRHRHVLVLGALCWAACGEDSGFAPLSLPGLLRRRGWIRPEGSAHLDLAERPAVTS